MRWDDPAPPPPPEEEEEEEEEPPPPPAPTWRTESTVAASSVEPVYDLRGDVLAVASAIWGRPTTIDEIAASTALDVEAIHRAIDVLDRRLDVMLAWGDAPVEGDAPGRG